MAREIGCYILTHRYSGYFYIGSSQHLSKRLSNHQYDLTKGLHCNRKLQAAFTGWSDLKVEINYTDTIEQARELEQSLIDRYLGSPFCCNLASDVSDPTAGVITADMRRTNIVAAHSALRGVPKSDEHRKKLSAGREGKLHGEETKEAISLSKSRKVEIDGVVYPSVAIAARELNINANTLRSRLAYKGKNGKYSGYRF